MTGRNQDSQEHSNTEHSSRSCRIQIRRTITSKVRRASTQILEQVCPAIRTYRVHVEGVSARSGSCWHLPEIVRQRVEL